MAAQRRPKRATLDGITIPRELQERSGSPTACGAADGDPDNLLMQITSQNFLGKSKVVGTKI